MKAMIPAQYAEPAFGMSARSGMPKLNLPGRMWPSVYVIAAVYFALHMATAGRYGYFRDALYYLACSRHLALGYVDQPPLFPLIAWFARHTLGTSLPALIFWPALAGAARIVLMAAFARELGAGRFGVTLAAALGAAPAVWWVIDHQFAMNALEALFWLGCAYVLLRMTKTGDRRLWLAFGAVAGSGLENKYSVALFAFALLLGLLLTSQRKLLATGWLWAGGIVALAIFLPNLVWNIQHHWPFMELMHNIRATGKDVVLSPDRYLLQQVLMMNPLVFPFWIGGLHFYLFAREGKPYRMFGFAFIIAIAIFLVLHGKDYYSAPAYTLVLAAGAVGAERLFAARALRPAWSRSFAAACVAWLLMAIVPLLPLVLPVLSLPAFIRYQSHLPLQPAKAETSFVGTTLPQYYADELPWQPMVAAVASVYHRLSPEERAKAAIFCDNFGQAAAVDFFGPRYGLPAAISGHQNYFLWGPRQYSGDIMLLVGVSEDDARKFFSSVEVGATLNIPGAYPYEQRPILIVRDSRENLQAAWPSLKDWR